MYLSLPAVGSDLRDRTGERHCHGLGSCRRRRMDCELRTGAVKARRFRQPADNNNIIFRKRLNAFLRDKLAPSRRRPVVV